MTVDLLILAGGQGTRLKKVVPNFPKPLAPIAGIPFLDLQLDFFRKFSCIDEIILAVCYKKEMIIERYREKKILFSQEEKALGTGGAIKKGTLLSKKKHLLVANGDTFLDCDIEDFLRFHLSMDADFSLCTVFQDAHRYGRIERDPSYRIQAFLPPMPQEGWTNAGIYCIKQSFLSFLPNDSFSLEEALPTLLDKRIFGYPVKGFFLDIGTEESYHQAQKDLTWVNMY